MTTITSPASRLMHARRDGTALVERDADPLTVIEADIVDLRTIADVRALVEAELTELVADATVDAVGLLLQELAARAWRARLLPLHVLARRFDGRVRVDITFRWPPTSVAVVLDRLLTDDGTGGALLVNHLADSYGLSVDGCHGKLWCEVPTLP